MSCAAVAVLVAAGSPAALAQSLCVVCTGPEATYRCQPEQGPAQPGDVRLGLMCITEIANRDGHQSCSIQRSVTSCAGELRTVAVAPGPAIQVAPAANQPPIPGNPPPPRAEVDKSGPPDTMAELAKRTATDGKQQLDKATDAVGDAAKKTGDAVGTAAKKSWRCLSSLFKDC